MKQLSLEQIQNAQQRILPILHNQKATPLIYSKRLSEKYGFEVWLKREDQTPVRSYKIRGAFNFISQLSIEEKKKGIVCASA
jgi:threonine dehydratase